MSKINYWTIKIYSRVELDSNKSEKLVAFLKTFKNGKICPEKYGLFEPLKYTFNKTSEHQLINWLSKKGDVSLKRVSSIKYDLIITDLRNKEFIVNNIEMPRKILTELVFFIDNIGDSVAQEILKEIHKIINIDYAFATPRNDYDEQNHLVLKSELQSQEISFETYVGDIIEITGIPGSYSVNFFGKDYAKWLKIKKGLIFEKQDDESIIFLRKNQKDEIKVMLGKDNFFDFAELRKDAQDAFRKNSSFEISSLIKPSKVPSFFRK